MTRVFVAQHPTEAHMIAGLLSSQGIETEVQGEPLFGARGEVPVTPSTLPSVWVVDDARLDEALAILRARPGSAPLDATSDEPWKCAKCGEMVEPQFSECWNCGTPRHS